MHFFKHQYWLFLFVFLFVVPCFSDFVDSTTLLFNDTEVKEYYLNFYVDNYEEQLKKNYDNGKIYMPARLKSGGITLDSIGIRYKGNSSFIQASHTPKKPYKFKFDKYKEYTFFDVKKLNFSNCFKDPSFMREKISYEISRTVMPSPRCSYAKIYINDTLIGLYLQVEQVDKKFLKEHFGKDSGNLYKAGDKGAGLGYLGLNQDDYEKLYELKTNEKENDWSRFIKFTKVTSENSNDLFLKEAPKIINLSNAIDHLTLNIIMSHFDSYTGSGRNYYLYDNPKTAQFYFIPWDMNESFGAFRNNWNVIKQDVLTLSNLNKRPLYKNIISNDSLKQIYLQRIDSMLNKKFTKDIVTKWVSKLKPVIEKTVQEDKNKFYTTEEFEKNIYNDLQMGPNGTLPGILSFVEDRTKNLKDQLAKYLDPYSIAWKSKNTSHIQIVNSNKSFWITNRSHEKMVVRILTVNGRVLAQKLLQPNRSFSPTVNYRGVVLVRYIMNDKQNVQKILKY